jgi:EF hand
VKIPVRTLLSLLMTLAASGQIAAQAPAQNPAPAKNQVPAQSTAPAEVVKIDFAALDKDANGRISKKEVEPVPDLEGVFDKLDTDHNGSLSSAEFAHWNRAGKATPVPRDPTTAPTGSAGAQHMSAPE